MAKKASSNKFSKRKISKRILLELTDKINDFRRDERKLSKQIDGYNSRIDAITAKKKSDRGDSIEMIQEKISDVTEQKSEIQAQCAGLVAKKQSYLDKNEKLRQSRKS